MCQNHLVRPHRKTHVSIFNGVAHNRSVVLCFQRRGIIFYTVIPISPEINIYRYFSFVSIHGKQKSTGMNNRLDWLWTYRVLFWLLCFSKERDCFSFWSSFFGHAVRLFWNDYFKLLPIIEWACFTLQSTKGTLRQEVSVYEEFSYCFSYKNEKKWRGSISQQHFFHCNKMTHVAMSVNGSGE